MNSLSLSLSLSLATYFLLFGAVTRPVLASVGSHYADSDPKSCRIDGDVNILGLGIRLSYYLQWLAAVLASYLAPGQLGKTSLAFSAFTLSSYAAIYHNATQGSYIAVDYHVTAMLTLFLGWSTYYFSPGRCKVDLDSPGPLAAIIGPRYTINKAFQGHWGFLMILFALTFFTSPWMYWKGNYIGHKPGCPTKFLFGFVFYSAIIDIYNPKWVLAVKVLSVPGCVLGLVCLVYGISLLILHACTPPSDDDEDSDIGACGKAIYTIGQLVLGGWVIAIAELTIRRNKLDLSGAPLTSSGQLIPLLVGAMALGVVFGDWVRSGVRKLGIPAALAAYMATATKTADAIQDRFRMGKGKAQDTSVHLENLVESQQSQEALRRPSNSDTESRYQSQRNLPRSSSTNV